jgi:hypothetical protein
MSNQFRYDSSHPEPGSRHSADNSPAGRGLLTAVILGGGVVVLFVIGAALGAWLVLWRPAQYEATEYWEAELAYVVETSVLPPGEHASIYAQLRRLARECDPERMSEAQLEEVLAALENSPVFVLLDVGAIEQDIVAKSGLSATEREDWKKTVRRAARGVHAGKVHTADFYAALPAGFFYKTELTVTLTEEWEEGAFDLPPAPETPASDEVVRASLSRLRTLAENAGIPDEPWSFDASDEFTRAVERALAVVKP